MVILVVPGFQHLLSQIQALGRERVSFHFHTGALEGRGALCRAAGPCVRSSWAARGPEEVVEEADGRCGCGAALTSLGRCQVQGHLAISADPDHALPPSPGNISSRDQSMPHPLSQAGCPCTTHGHQAHPGRQGPRRVGQARQESTAQRPEQPLWPPGLSGSDWAGPSLGILF